MLHNTTPKPNDAETLKPDQRELLEKEEDCCNKATD